MIGDLPVYRLMSVTRIFTLRKFFAMLLSRVFCKPNCCYGLQPTSPRSLGADAHPSGSATLGLLLRRCLRHTASLTRSFVRSQGRRAVFPPINRFLVFIDQIILSRSWAWFSRVSLVHRERRSATFSTGSSK